MRPSEDRHRDDRRDAFRARALEGFCLPLGMAVFVVLVASCTSGGSDVPTTGATIPVTGARVSLPVPSLPLINDRGRPTSLADFRGKIVVLAPFLTLCAEQCPITTGAFIDLHRDVLASGLGNEVAFVETTVDANRDTPARLRAYSGMAGLSWDHLLTGTPSEIVNFWRFFHIFYRRVSEPHPATIDWWTHQPETYDVQHEDGLFFLDSSGVERLVVVGPSAIDGDLPLALKRLLDHAGLENLSHPQGAWTISQALRDLGYMLGRSIRSIQ